MSNELQFEYGIHSTTVKAEILNATGRVWDGTAFVEKTSLALAAWQASLLTVNEVSDNSTPPAGTGFYRGDGPQAIDWTQPYTINYYDAASPGYTGLVGVQTWAAGALSKQDVADAAPLAPTTGTPASGSLLDRIASLPAAVWAVLTSTLTAAGTIGTWLAEKVRAAGPAAGDRPADAPRVAQIRSQALALIAEITAHPKPTYTIDGQQVHWNEYLAQLEHTVQWCDQVSSLESPREVRSQGYT